MKKATLDFLQAVFKIRPEELQRTGLAFTYLFMAVGAFIISRITRTVLFLELPDYRELLPLMYIVQAGAVSTIMFGYARIERVLRRDKTNIIGLSAIIVANLVFRSLLEGGASRGLAMAFYIWVEIFGTILIVQFWSFANEIFHSRQAKRLFALIGGGGVLANIFIGFGIRGSVKTLGTENLIYVICICLAVSLMAVRALGKDASAELTAAKDRGGRKDKGRAPVGQKVFATRHVQLIAVVIVLTYLVSTVVDYQFQVIVGDSIPGKDERSAYFGTFFGVTGIFAAGIQFFITSRLLERFGVLVALLLLPVGMVLGSSMLLMVPMFPLLWAGAFTKGSENTLRYSVNDTTLQLLYLPVPAQIRGRAKAFIDGILKPTSIGVAGLVLAVLKGSFDDMLGIDTGLNVAVQNLSWVVLGGLCLWIGALVMLRQEYLQSLLRTLNRRRLNFADATFEINDESTTKVLHKALTSQDVGKILHALDLVRFVSPPNHMLLESQLAALLEHEAEEVRVAALEYWRGTEESRQVDKVRLLLKDESSSVRAAAVGAYCAMNKSGAIGTVGMLQEDADEKVRSAAIVGLIRYGGLDGVLACAETLKGMLGSEDPKERAKAAWILGEVGVQNFYQPLMPMFEDESEDVRLAAIEAAGKLKSPELITSLIPNLQHGRLVAATVSALSRYGAEIKPTVAALLADKDKPAPIRAHACKVLARLGDAESAAMLADHLADENGLIRLAVIQALNHLQGMGKGAHIQPEVVTKTLVAESEFFFRQLAIEQDLQLDGKTPLLEDALAHRKAQALERVLGLLSLKYSAETVELVSRNLKSSVTSTRANAVEVLDNLLSKDEKPYVVPIFDDQSRERKLVAGDALFSLTRSNRNARLTEALNARSPWMRACATMAVAEWEITALQDKVWKMLEDPTALCRETAIVAIRRMTQNGELREHLGKLVDDPSPTVRRYAEFVRGTFN